MRTIKIKVGKIPGQTREVEVQDGAPVSTAVETAGFSLDENYQIHLNSEIVENPDHVVVSPGDAVLLCKKVKGN